MNCGSDILKGYSDQSVYWSSSSVPEIGIDEFMKYSNVIKIIIDSYLEYKNAKFDLGCLIDGKYYLFLVEDFLSLVRLYGVYRIPMQME